LIEYNCTRANQTLLALLFFLCCLFC